VFAENISEPGRPNTVFADGVGDIADGIQAFCLVKNM
jgi:hypothetical protein